MNRILSACIELAAAQRLHDLDPERYEDRLTRAQAAYIAVGGKP